MAGCGRVFRAGTYPECVYLLICQDLVRARSITGETDGKQSQLEQRERLEVKVTKQENAASRAFKSSFERCVGGLRVYHTEKQILSTFVEFSQPSSTYDISVVVGGGIRRMSTNAS